MRSALSLGIASNILDFSDTRTGVQQSPMASYPDLLIIGGGVIGLTCALRLADRTLRVEVLDRGDLGQEASWAGAGIIPPGNPDRAATPADQLRAFSSVRFAAFSDQLLSATGIDNGYRRCGGIEFVDPADEAIVAAWRDEGLNRELVSFSCRKEPGLQLPTPLGYYFPDMAQVRNPRHLKALLSKCQSDGVDLVPGCPVRELETDGDRVVALRLESGERRVAGQFLIAAGAWSDELTRPLGFAPGVHPVRGQIVLFCSPEPPVRHIVLHGKHYLVPREDGRTLVGSTEEPEAGFAKQTTSTAIDELTHLAYSWVPALREAAIERTWAGLRPGSPDGLPFIGRVPGYRNLFVNAGHFRAGIQLSLASAEAMRSLMFDFPFPIDLNYFRPDRPPRREHRPAFRS